jgi:putative SOS response-associated peptidase YedK
MCNLCGKPGRGRRLLYGFLTTEPHDVVAPIHPNPMLVVLPPRKNANGLARARHYPGSICVALADHRDRATGRLCGGLIVAGF